MLSVPTKDCEPAPRSFTADFEAAGFLTVGALGPNQEVTPEGYLLCKAVQVARIGEQIYAPNETPVQTGPQGYVVISRDESELFSDNTIRSLNGKPITNDHPALNVGPQNYRALVCGVVLNPRRGDGAQRDFLVADLLITDPAAITAVRAGKREVSCGYNNDYDQSAPGRGRQRNIIFNHVALVERGRCGSSCAIGDKAPTEIPAMSTKSIFQRVMDALASKDEKAFDEAMAEANRGEGRVTIINAPTMDKRGRTRDAEGEKDEGDEPTKDNEFEKRMSKVEDAMAGIVKTQDRMLKTMDAMAKSLDKAKDSDPDDVGTTDEDGDETDTKDANKKILGKLQFEAPPGTNDAAIARAVSTNDSAFLRPTYQDTIAVAEIIVPGIQKPTLDADPVRAADSLCKFRRATLDLAYAQPATRMLIDQIGMVDTKTATCDSVRSLFNAVGAVRRMQNNGAAPHAAAAGIVDTRAGVHASPHRNVADLQAAMDKHYKRA